MSDDGGAAAPALGPGPAVLAVDVGGTDTKSALVDADGVVRAVVRRPTPRDGDRTGQRVVEEAAAVAAELAERHPDVAPAALGLVVPGVVDDAAGVGVWSENLGWRDMPFAAAATARLGLPVAVGHDVAAAGWAELRCGAAAGFRDALVVTLGTGIAAAVLLDGRPYRGGGMAGEIGHARVADGPGCVCGGRGCLEAVASAAAIARRYTARTGTHVPGAREVLAAVEAGDAPAAAVWDEALDGLALGLSHAVALVAPQVIVLGGGLSHAGDALLVPLGERLDALLTYHRRPLLAPAQLGGDAGVLGAALRARELLTEDHG
ncbi:ROK family protein [Isoptericola sp. BMS4]|uniref:ROK family protein n=1 Tax=Isoptericola sp. BMS4 TaxID=2527875 RepID=UPI001F0DC269|nr:ROK family protein [Isoptericola sp. BMS4]